MNNAQKFMVKNGNFNQWTDLEELINLVRQDIQLGNSYVCMNGNEISATFAFFIGDDPTYAIIEEGSWLNNDTYGVMHRVASTGKVKGSGSFCIDWCFDRCHNLKIDTHKDNIPMQSLLEKKDFKKCGIIFIENGDERIAYQKSKTSHFLD